MIKQIYKLYKLFIYKLLYSPKFTVTKRLLEAVVTNSNDRSLYDRRDMRTAVKVRAEPR